MDEQITLTQNQIFSASLKVSKSRSLVKRRMQSLGLKFTESQDVRNRLAGIEKGALKCVGQFCHDNDAESLSAMAIILSELFLLQGELSTSNEYAGWAHSVCGPLLSSSCPSVPSWLLQLYLVGAPSHSASVAASQALLSTPHSCLLAFLQLLSHPPISCGVRD